MITAPMCFSILRVPKFGVPTLANLWRENFHPLNRNYGHSSWYDQLGFRIYNLEGGQNKRWTRKSMSTKAGRKAKTDPSSKPSNIRNEILEESVSTSCTISINKSEKNGTQKLQCCNIQETITKDKELARPVTVITFDIETTGFSRELDRIVEIALQDLSGGENSTFQTLINPECYIPNAVVHGITSRMVSRPDVPRMKELIPILLQFIKSRQKPDGYVLLVAHNARTFDVPFLLKEFSRCSVDIPLNWLFFDNILLARQLMKSTDSKIKKISLQALREYYNIPLVGSAHRAMSDVRTLSLILQRLTFDLKLGIPDLIERSFTTSDLINKKKN
ncbi:exonuclease DPD1, chloroplastic/mitochondrial [Cucurbita pepo subsp. pepo]|uniref:exonuclease DPD1, chloroplastic/mitochondrial n=1 Tax=Cucurbita pepo subsp. pepo TaxID=3664 RepID=UPI000C9D850A|nr:exonuclease DPD1, chloroplastic/mitochondrial [Cucurbita pepo subsp. pepo]